MPAEEKLPEKWGKYELIASVGSGGMGNVYKAYDPTLERFVAIKILKVDDPVLARRFLREARAQAKVKHENICEVYEAGEFEGKPYIVMRFIDGKNLREARREMPLEARINVIKKVAEALHEAHKQGLIHRDVKPTNIMVEITEEGEWKPYIVDFGLVKEKEFPHSTVTRMIIGTPYFMSPEQARGKNELIDRRSDVYSLGATLYFLLTGRPPFEGSVIEVIRKVIDEEPVPLKRINPSIPRDLETIVMKCLEKEPRHRYPSAKALAEELERFLKGEPIEAKRKLLFYRLSKKIRKHKIVALALLISMTISGIFLGISLHEKARQRTITRLAREYDGEVKYIENLLWYAYTKPIHDIRTEKTLIEDRLKLLEKLIRQRGTIAYGPGFYALARGYMSLGNYKTARKYLELAINKYNYKMSEANFAMGLTLIILYFKELYRLERITDKYLKVRKQRELEREYLNPALYYINQANSKGAYPWQYVFGVISFLRKDYNSALKYLEYAYQKFPWLYEAKKFQGDIYSVLGGKEEDRGNIKKALSMYRKAEKTYRELIQTAQSYPLAYKALLRVRVSIANLLFFQYGLSSQELLEKALSLCKNTILIDPSDPEVYLLTARVYATMADHLIFSGNPPDEPIRNSIKMARKAIEIDPNYFQAYQEIGDAYLILGAYERAQGKDPTNFLQKAEEYYKTSLELNPSDIFAIQSLATVYWNRGAYLMEIGKNPLQYFNEGIKILKKILKLRKGLYTIYNRLGNIYIDMASYNIKTGEACETSLENAITYFKKGLNIAPNYVLLNSNLGYSYLIKAKYLKKLGKYEEALKYIKESEKLLRKVIKIKPDLIWAYIFIADNECLRAELKMLHGKSPLQELYRAEQYLNKGMSFSRSSKYTDLYINLINVYKLRAIWYHNRKEKEFKSTVKKGILLSERLLRTHPNLPEALKLKKELIKLINSSTNGKSQSN